jgi:hypothetical protein
MRQALNGNPVVQIGVVGVLVLIVGFLFMTNMKSSTHPITSTTAATPGATSVTGTPAAPGATSAAPATGSSSAAPLPSATGSVSAAGPAVTPASLIPGPGLPAPVVAAWKHGDAIALLIVRGGGIDDRLVRGSVESLKHEAGVAVFVTRAKSVARYARITQGVGVDRVPALVVVRPRKESGSIPQALVKYGFRDSPSVVQAVHDAIYNGPDDLPYSPR